MSKVLSSKKHISGSDIYNLWICAKVLMKNKIEADEHLHPLDCDDNLINNLTKALDDKSDDILDISAAHATEIYFNYNSSVFLSSFIFDYCLGVATA